MNDVSTSVTLSSDEAAALTSLISNYLGDLRAEVYKTEDFDLRGELKQREALLRAVLAKLPASV